MAISFGTPPFAPGLRGRAASSEGPAWTVPGPFSRSYGQIAKKRCKQKLAAFSLSKKVKPSSTKGIALRSMPRLYARGVQFDTSLREMCFPRRTRRRRKRLNLFFRCGEKTLRGFFDSLTLQAKTCSVFYSLVAQAIGPYAGLPIFLSSESFPFSRQAKRFFCLRSRRCR